MTRDKIKRKTSPIHRIVLTHGQQGVPKFIREDTEQFFAAVARQRSKTISISKSIISNGSQSSYQTNFDLNKKENTQSSISILKHPLPMLIPPPPPTPVAVRTPNSSQRAKGISSASVCVRQPALSPIMPSSNSSVELSTPLIESATPSLPSLSRQARHSDSIDQNVFRRAYERAISVARSRLLFHDPYSLTRSNTTHGILYSYYDHTPMCVFTRGNACNHRQDTTMKKKFNRKTKGNLFRKEIFNDVVVENYIPYEKNPI